MASDAPSAEASALRIHLLGGFRVWVGARPIEERDWRLRKAASLLKLLALAPGHTLHREQLVEWLWPDHEPHAARHHLKYALPIAPPTPAPHTPPPRSTP